MTNANGEAVLELRAAERLRPRARAVGPHSFAVLRGTLTALVGPSGAGKSTLLALLAGVERADAGEVRWNGRDVTRLSESTLAVLRRGRIGVVGQSYALLEHLPLWRGVAAPLIAQGVALDVQRERARDVLEELGLDAALADRRPEALSGGERQRAALASALLAAGEALIADEPTSNQDPRSAELVIAALERRASRGIAVAVATHDERLARLASRTLELVAGR